MVALVALLSLTAPAVALDRGAVHRAMDEEAGWTQIQTKDGIRIYRKSIPGLEMDAFKGVKTLDADVDPERMFELLCDVGAHEKYSPSLAETGMIDPDPARMIYYQVMKSPPLLPVAPRYWINTAEMERDVGGEPGHHRRRWSSLPLDQVPEVHKRIQAKYEGAVPLAYTMGVWELDPEPDGSITVKYYSVSDPGGRIPDNLAQGLSGRTLPSTIERFEDAARR